MVKIKVSDAQTKMTPLLSSLIESLKQKAESAKYIVYVKDLQENFVWSNSHAKQLLKSDSSGEIKAALFYNDLAIAVKDECVSKVYFLGDTNSEKPIDGSGNRSFAFTKWPVKSNLNDEIYIVGFGFEITDWLIGADTLAFYKTILNTMPDSFVITEPVYPFKILFCNSSFESLAEMPRTEILGKSPTEVFTKYDEDEPKRKVFNEKIKNFEIAEQVFKNRNVKGKEIYSHLKVIPLYFGDKKEPSYLIGIQRNITQTYKLKALSKKKTDKLKALFNSTSNYIWMLDESGLIVEMNDTAKIQGKYLNQNLHKNIQFNEGRWWQNNYREIKNFCDQIYATGISLSLKTKILTSLDKEIPVKLIGTPIFKTESRNIEYVVVEATDISDLEKALDDARSVAAGALQEAGAIPQDVDVDESYFMEYTNNQVEKITRAEVGLKKLEPEVAKLNEAVFNPEIGLITRTGNIDKNVEEIKEALINPGLIKFVKNTPKFLDNRIVRWTLIILLGAAGVNVVENFSHNVEFIWNEIQELDLSQETDFSNP